MKNQNSSLQHTMNMSLSYHLHELPVAVLMTAKIQ